MTRVTQSITGYHSVSQRYKASAPKVHRKEAFKQAAKKVGHDTPAGGITSCQRGKVTAKVAIKSLNSTLKT